MSATRERTLPRSASAMVVEAVSLPIARRRVLDVVAASESPMSVLEIADALMCHPSTVRPYLNELVEAGLLDVSERRSGGRGRPAVQYSARVPDPSRIHQGLVNLVSSSLEHSSPEDAHRVGVEWGTQERLRDIPGSQGASADEVFQLLIRLGFDPAWDGEDRVHVRSCPFNHSKTGTDENLWQLHLGLVEGLLGDGGTDVRLHPDDPRGGCALDFHDGAGDASRA